MAVSGFFFFNPTTTDVTERIDLVDMVILVWRETNTKILTISSTIAHSGKEVFTESQVELVFHYSVTACC